MKPNKIEEKSSFKGMNLRYDQQKEKWKEVKAEDLSHLFSGSLEIQKTIDEHEEARFQAEFRNPLDVEFMEEMAKSMNMYGCFAYTIKNGKLESIQDPVLMANPDIFLGNRESLEQNDTSSPENRAQKQ